MKPLTCCKEHACEGCKPCCEIVRVISNDEPLTLLCRPDSQDLHCLRCYLRRAFEPLTADSEYLGHLLMILNEAIANAYEYGKRPFIVAIHRVSSLLDTAQCILSIQIMDFGEQPIPHVAYDPSDPRGFDQSQLPYPPETMLSDESRHRGYLIMSCAAQEQRIPFKSWRPPGKQANRFSLMIDLSQVPGFIAPQAFHS